MAIDRQVVADQGITSLQTAIDALNALEAQPGANIPAIVAPDLRTLQLKQVEEEPSNGG